MTTFFLVCIFIAELLLTGLLILAGYMLVSGIISVPWVRTRKKISQAMMDLAEIKPGQRVLDLGSGDGSLVLEAGKRGAIGVGIEQIGFLVRLSRCRAKFAKQPDCTFIRANIFKTELPDADIIFTYLFPEFNKKLTPILKQRYPSGTRVVSRDFVFEDLKEISQKKLGMTMLFLYEIS